MKTRYATTETAKDVILMGSLKGSATMEAAAPKGEARGAAGLGDGSLAFCRPRFE